MSSKSLFVMFEGASSIEDYEAILRELEIQYREGTLSRDVKMLLTRYVSNSLKDLRGEEHGRH